MKYHFKTKPYKHQVEALRTLLSDPCSPVGGSLPMDMGTGKTKVAIDYANILELKGLITQVLVVAPIDALGVWNLEVIKHSGSKTLKWRIVNYDRTFNYSITRKSGVYEVRNLDQLATYCREGPTLLVLDESDEIANPQSKRSKAVHMLAKLFCVRTLNMTGTPIRKNPLDLFAQYRNIDEGILGGSWGIFKRTYATWGGYGGYQLIHHMNLKQLFTKIEPYTYACKLEDVHDMPRRMEPEIIPVRLDESKDVYDRFARDMIVQIGGMDFEAPIILTKLLRLRQMTGGFIRTDEKRKRIGYEKERALKSKLTQMYRGDIQKIVIYATFLDDMRTIAGVCKDIGYHVIPFWGGLPRDKRERFIAHFEEIRKPTVWLSQSNTGTRSIPLTAAHHTLYYSLSDRYVSWEQSQRRTWRPPQQFPCYYGVFLAEDTVDEALWLALRTKQSFAKLVYQNPELIH